MSTALVMLMIVTGLGLFFGGGLRGTLYRILATRYEGFVWTPMGILVIAYAVWTMHAMRDGLTMRRVSLSSMAIFRLKM